MEKQQNDNDTEVDISMSRLFIWPQHSNFLLDSNNSIKDTWPLFCIRTASNYYLKYYSLEESQMFVVFHCLVLLFLSQQKQQGSLLKL